MAVTDHQYIERFIDDVDKVEGGRNGALSEDRWLVNNYDASKYRLIAPFMDSEDRRICYEVILLLTYVHERAAMSAVRRIGESRGEKVGMACLGYLTEMKRDDEEIPGLLDILDHARGTEFSSAARRLAAIAREEDIPRVRKVYGQVGGTMRDEARIILERIISRNPGMEKNRDLILSLPVYPDEDAFDGFLDRSIEYLDVRYRNNVLPRKEIKRSTYSSVVRALGTMRTRLYNEADNLRFYGVDKEDRFEELSALMKWANDDLSTKTVVDPAGSSRSRTCPQCGGMLVCYKGIWMCPDCGGQ